jgi:hypothetical protein
MYLAVVEHTQLVHLFIEQIVAELQLLPSRRGPTRCCLNFEFQRRNCACKRLMSIFG